MLNIPNTLAFIRLLLAPIMFLFLVNQDASIFEGIHASWLNYIAAFIFVLASATDFFVSNAMIYGRSIIGGYGKFMKLRPAKGLQNIYTTTVGAFVRGSQEAAVRMGTTEEDIAKAVYFLCTEESSWITGQTLIVDGGTTFR